MSGFNGYNNLAPEIRAQIRKLVIEERAATSKARRSERSTRLQRSNVISSDPQSLSLAHPMLLQMQSTNGPPFDSLMDGALSWFNDDFSIFDDIIDTMINASELLKEIAGGSSYEKHYSVASLACVDREWQRDVEQGLFKSLNLEETLMAASPSDFAKFEMIVRGSRRKYLKSLKVTLGARNSLCKSSELADCLARLFFILSKWDRNDVGEKLLSVQVDIASHPGFVGLKLKSVRPIHSVEVVGSFNISWSSFSADALLALYQKLPNLSRVGFQRSPYYCPREYSQRYLARKFAGAYSFHILFSPAGYRITSRGPFPLPALNTSSSN